MERFQGQSKATVRNQINERTAFSAGSHFAATGAYERIRGQVHYAIADSAVRGLDVEDLELAPRGRDGRVHFAGDVLILRPVDLARGNRRLLFDFPNRGNVRSLQF